MIPKNIQIQYRSYFKTNIFNKRKKKKKVQEKKNKDMKSLTYFLRLT